MPAGTYARLQSMVDIVFLETPYRPSTVDKEARHCTLQEKDNLLFQVPYFYTLQSRARQHRTVQCCKVRTGTLMSDRPAVRGPTVRHSDFTKAVWEEAIRHCPNPLAFPTPPCEYLLENMITTCPQHLLGNAVD